MVARQLFDEKMEACQYATDFGQQFVMEIVATFSDSPLMPLEEIGSNPKDNIFPKTNDLKKTMSGCKL